MLSPLAENKYHPSLSINAITRLQAKTDAVVEASDAKDPKTDAKAKLKTKKRKSKKSSKTMVGTPIDPVTMQNASDDSDDPSSSESLAESQRVTQSKVPRTHHQLSVDKPGTYPKPEQEIQRVQEAIQLVEETQAEMEPEPRPILNAWATPTTVTKVPQLGKSLQIPSTISKKVMKTMTHNLRNGVTIC